MENKNNPSKELCYQLLDVFQTNSPKLISEKQIRRTFEETYANALICFAIDIQRAFALDEVFNCPEQISAQKDRIRDLYEKHFSIYCEEGDAFMKSIILTLIGGEGPDCNFAYGLKLYFLFEDDLDKDILRKNLFQSRIESNLVSKYFVDHPKHYRIPSELVDECFFEPLRRKLERYKIFNSETKAGE